MFPVMYDYAALVRTCAHVQVHAAAPPTEAPSRCQNPRGNAPLVSLGAPAGELRAVGSRADST